MSLRCISAMVPHEQIRILCNGLIITKVNLFITFALDLFFLPRVQIMCLRLNVDKLWKETGWKVIKFYLLFMWLSLGFSSVFVKKINIHFRAFFFSFITWCIYNLENLHEQKPNCIAIIVHSVYREGTPL